MGCPQIATFDIAFIKRSKEILENTETKSDFTLLLNCLLGLLILPNEFYKRNGNSSGRYDYFKFKIGKMSENIKKIFSNENIEICENNEIKIRQKCIFRTHAGYEKSANNVPVWELIRKIRNGIAHFNIVPTKDMNGNNWNGIILKNINDKKIETLDLYITEEELRNFALFIVKKYEAFNEKRQKRG